MLERAEREAIRIAEALVFASAEPVSENFIAERLPRGIDVKAIMRRLKEDYARAASISFRSTSTGPSDGCRSLLCRPQRRDRGQETVARGTRSAGDHRLPPAGDPRRNRGHSRRAGRQGTLDVLMEAGWVRFRGRRRTPGRPVTLGTTRDFLDHFGLEELRDLPGLDELKGAGLLSGRIPANFNIPLPMTGDELTEDEDPITQLDLEELGLLTPGGEADE
jgi:segregation and condensation protein B